MRRFLGLSLAIFAMAACSPVEMEMGNGGTLVPSATPDPSQFNAIQSNLVANNCGNGTACHAAPAAAAAGVILVTTSAATPADIENNARWLSCANEITTYDPPAGTLTEYFCASASAALPIGTVGQGPPTSQHQSGVITPGWDAADCTALFTWLATGNGNPPACP